MINEPSLGPGLKGLVDRIDIKGHSRTREIPDRTADLMPDSDLQIAGYTLEHGGNGSLGEAFRNTALP